MYNYTRFIKSHKELQQVSQHFLVWKLCKEKLYLEQFMKGEKESHSAFFVLYPHLAPMWN